MDWIIIFALGLVVGMFIMKQIRDSSYGHKQNEKLMKNMENWFPRDNIESTENITHYYTHIKKEDVN